MSHDDGFNQDSTRNFKGDSNAQRACQHGNLIGDCADCIRTHRPDAKRGGEAAASYEARIERLRAERDEQARVSDRLEQLLQRAAVQLDRALNARRRGFDYDTWASLVVDLLGEIRGSKSPRGGES